MKNSSSSVSSTSRSSSQTLQCHVVVEPSSIDFLNEGAVFVAGSTNDCGCFISPIPQPKKSHRRSPSASKR